MRLSLEALEPRILLSAVVTDAHILAFISTDNGTPGEADIGDVIKVTWDNSATGDNNAGLVGNVIADYAQLGGPANVTMVDDGTDGDAVSGDKIYTATYTVVAGNIDDTHLNVNVTAATATGAGHDADTSNLSVDNIPPNVTDGNINTFISFDTTVGGVANIGDVITTTWNDSAGGDNSGGINNDFVGATADFSAFGGGSAVTMVDNGTGNDAFAGDGVYTASFNVVPGAVDAVNLHAKVTATDDGGNKTTTTDSTNISVDSIAPTVTDGNILVALTTDGRTGGVADINDVITITWDNRVTGDNNTDVLTAETVNLSSIDGPSAATLFDDGTHGDAVAADNIFTLAYTIRAGNQNTVVRNVSVTVTDDAGNVTTAGDTSDLTYNNGPVATYASGGALVSIYDVAGPIDIAPSDVSVKFEKTGDVDKVSLVGHAGGTGMGIVISGAREIESIQDSRNGAALTPVSFIAADTQIQNLVLKTGIGSYNLNGLTLDGIAFAADIDGDADTLDAQALWDSSGIGKATFAAQVNGDIWLQDAAPVSALGSLSILNGGYEGDMTLLGNAGTISMVGGNFNGSINVDGSLQSLIIKASKAGGGGVFQAGSNVFVDGLLKSGSVSTYQTNNVGTPFGFNIGSLGKLTLGTHKLTNGSLPFHDGDFQVVT
jgi:hypothetical protein